MTPPPSEGRAVLVLAVLFLCAVASRAIAQTVAIDEKGVHLKDGVKIIKKTATIGGPAVSLGEVRIVHPPNAQRAYTVFAERESKWLKVEDPHYPVSGGAHFPIKVQMEKGRAGVYKDDLIVDVRDPQWKSVGKVRIHVVIKFTQPRTKTKLTKRK